MRPILSYIFADFIARQYRSNETERVSAEIFKEIARKYALTDREEAVLMLELYGHTRQEIAKFFAPRWNHLNEQDSEEKTGR